MSIALTFEPKATRYAVKNGQIYYVKLSKPCAVSDSDNPFAQIDIAPYTEYRTLSYGVYVDTPNGYSSTPQNYRKIWFKNSANAQKSYAEWCTQFGCNLSWEEAKKLAGWC